MHPLRPLEEGKRPEGGEVYVRTISRTIFHSKPCDFTDFPA